MREALADIYGKSKLVWVGAHPDDEQYASFFLKDFCKMPGKSCHIISLTKGENGKCQKAKGCNPDLITVRSREFAKSASYLGAQWGQYDLPDGSAPNRGGVLAAWGDQKGGVRELVGMMSGVLQGIQPDLILTFDPRHGTTCHADHRATGELVGLAAGALGIPLSNVYLLETVTTAEGLVPATDQDPNLKVGSVDRSWKVLVHLLDKVYKSQHGKAAVRSARRVSADGRTLSFLRADQANVRDPRYNMLCD